MDNPKISVIVPVYNAEKYLHRCIDSILAQTFTDFEMLLIDDGSTDKSGDICDEYAKKDKRIRVFHKENGGVSSARNVGLDNAIGEWICFVDSDDDICSNYIQTFIALQTKQLADLYVVGCNMIMSDTSKKLELKDEYYAFGQIWKFIMDSRKVSMLGVPWNKLFCAKILRDNRLRFDERISSYEDELFVMSYVLNVNSILTSSLCTYNYLIRNVISLSKKYIEIKQHIQIAHRLCEYGEKISSNDVFLRHLKEDFSRHLQESILRLYYSRNAFNRAERIEILKCIIGVARENGVCEILFKQLRNRKFLSLNVYIIDLEGSLLNKWNRLKSKIK